MSISPPSKILTVSPKSEFNQLRLVADYKPLAIFFARFGACVGNISGPFFFQTAQAPKYQLGIGSILVSNCLELALFFLFRLSYIRANKKKDADQAQAEGRGEVLDGNATAFR